MNRKRLGSIFITLILCLLLSGCSTVFQPEGNDVNGSKPELKTGKIMARAERGVSSTTPETTGKSTRTLDAKGMVGGNTSTPPAGPRAHASGNPAGAQPGVVEAQDKTKIIKESPDALTDQQVRLVVTRDFGQSLISDRWVKIDQPTSALSVTTANLEVKTAYGGTFINSINGISSGYTGKAGWDKEKKDWFFYYNGKISSAGAGDVEVKAGDTIWWDYHEWSGKAKDLPPVPPGAGS